MLISDKQTFKCDICGTQNEWVKGQWIAHVFLLSAKKMIEHEFHLCSKECDQKLSAMNKKDRLNLAVKAIQNKIANNPIKLVDGVLTNIY